MTTKMATKATATKKEDIALMGHLFRRAGFGATYDKLESYVAKGYEATVEELLDPESQPPLDEDLMMRLNLGWQTRVSGEQGRTWWFYRMVNGERPLQEKTAVFWHSLLCTGNVKVDNSRQMNVTVDNFRRWGLGSFRDLMLQLAADPGMIYYLDNNTSHKKAINENWGRELLELFSMGVGNYTEDDVKEASRGFTGWSVAPSFPIFPYGSPLWEFLYDASDHDDDQKAFLGGQGRFNGDDIVEIICQQPATARFLARQLYNFFVADEAPVPQWGDTPPQDPEAIDALVQAYFDSHYEIRSMLRVLLNSRSFKDARFTKVKSPTEVVAGTLRLTKDFSLPTPFFNKVVELTGFMGQELYNPPTVEGWHTGAEWIDSGTLVERVNFLAGQLGDTSKQGVQEIAQRLTGLGRSLTAEQLVDGCTEQLGGIALSDDTRRTLIEAAGQGGPINTNSRDFPKRAAGLLALMAATKEYQFN